MASNSDVDLVLRHLGNFGLYQFKVYVLSCLPIFIAGAITTALVFTTVVPSHRCFVEGCDLGSLNDRDVVGLQSYNDSFLKFTIPKVGNTEQLDSCRLNGRQDVTSFDLCLAQLFDNRTQNTCDEYVFEQSVFENTVVTEVSLRVMKMKTEYVLPAKCLVSLIWSAHPHGLFNFCSLYFLLAS